MGVSKVEFGDETLIDLTEDTVTPQSLLSGYSAHNKAGELIEGLLQDPEELNKEIETLKTNINDGKKLVANAITAKGVATATDAAFATMATNVGKIETCLRWKNTSNGSYKFVQNGDRWIANNRGINSSTATSTWKVTVQAATAASIGWRTATESPDKLSISLNGTTVLSATGGVKSSETSIALNLVAGENTLVATYTKDGSVHSYGDVAYVILPPIGEQPGMYKYQSKSVTPSTSAQTVYPDAGYDGLYSVSVGASSGGGNITSVGDITTVELNSTFYGNGTDKYYLITYLGNWGNYDTIFQKIGSTKFITNQIRYDRSGIGFIAILVNIPDSSSGFKIVKGAKLYIAPIKFG